MAFVGGFSAGKSSLVNAFLGRYLLPESTEVTTAVPTFIQATTNREYATLNYLSGPEVDALEELYRNSFAEKFKLPELTNMPVRDLLERLRSLTSEGESKKLFEYYEAFLVERRSREIPDRGLQKECSLEDMAAYIRDEKEAMFLDRVNVFVNASDLPPDVQIVDLPGISVPNPRHKRLTYQFVTRDAHAIVFILRSTQLFSEDELDLLEKIRAGDSSIAEKTFWVINRWDALTDEHSRDSTIANFRERMREANISDTYALLKTNARHGLLSQLALRGEVPSDPKLQSQCREYENALPTLYGNDHNKAFQDSEIPQLQREVLYYLNHRIRHTTLRAVLVQRL